MNWAAVSAISTFFAGIVALIIPFLMVFLRNRPKLSIEILNSGRFSEEPSNKIVVNNRGVRIIHICRILYLDNENELKEINQDFDLPSTIIGGDSMEFDSPFINHNIEKIKKIYIENNEGKRKLCNMKSLKRAKQISKMYIGKRLIYPSMGDVIEEKKAKKHYLRKGKKNEI